MPGAVNGGTDPEADGPDILLQIDANNAFDFIPPEQACRVTGGGNDTAGIQTLLDGTTEYDNSVAEGQMTPVAPVKINKNGKVIGKQNVAPMEPYSYTMGGQAGANTGKQPQPKGEWTHTSKVQSPNGLKFTFHAGTASAPDGTEIDKIICTDEGWCEQARPAPNKQIDFVGIGTFKNLSWTSPLGNDSVINAAGIEAIQVEPNNPNQGTMPTYHWFQVHIEDLGEPGNKAEDGAVCPPMGSGNDPFAKPPVVGNVADCDCADFYHIRIYQAIDEPAFDEDGNITNPDKVNVIYEVYGYIDGGNFQIHPLTGFDLK
jgi:hypothetical protein